MDIASMDEHLQHKPIRIDEELALTAVDLFVSVISVDPPFSVVLTD